MMGYLILHVVHIAGKIIIESEIDGISRGDNMAGMMKLLNPIEFF